MERDLDRFLDAELIAAPKTLTPRLFHYTSAQAAIFGILAAGKLRLSPFESTNDLWESQPTYYNLSAHSDDEGVLQGDEIATLWAEIDRHIRMRAKVACLTQDWDLPDSVMDRDALRGWGHLSLWAHYGAGHTGVCLEFDRDLLVSTLKASGGLGVEVFHGPVHYQSVSIGPGPYGVDIGQVKEFGVDAVAMVYAKRHADAIFFAKHQDWSSEAEYRLVRMNRSSLPYELEIGSALRRIVLGHSFPAHWDKALAEALERYPEVEVQQTRFHNRRLWCDLRAAPPAVAQIPSWMQPRRLGATDERVAALVAAEALAAQLRDGGKLLTADLHERMRVAMADLAQGLSELSGVEISVHEHIDAVPVSQRRRAPGVVGEIVHFELGYIVVVNNAVDKRDALVSSVALQVLDDGVVRLHGAVRTENLRLAPNHMTEHWRIERSAPTATIDASWDEVVSELLGATRAGRDAFEVLRASHTDSPARG